jgi:hypothetical protein
MDIALSSNGNSTPAVRLTAITEGTVSYTPAQISFTVSASDSDGSIRKVEFFANNVKIGESTVSPYSFTWVNAVPGSYRISARATDNMGAATNSAGVDVVLKAYTFDQWKIDHGISANTPDDAAASDGVPNLLNYALGPNASGNGSPVVKIDGGNLILTYSKLRSDVTYSVERSVDLIRWTSDGVEQNDTGPLITASTPINKQTKLFFHLRVTHP